MAVRLGGPEDYDEIVRRALRFPLSNAIRWALEPGEDLVACRLAYTRWLVAGLLRVGRIWVDDTGGIAGGRRLRLTMRDKLRRPVVKDEESRSVASGAYSYPDVSRACQQRMLTSAGDAMRLRSEPRRTFVVQLWGAPPEVEDNPSLIALVDHARGIGHRCLAVTSGLQGTDLLRQAGFAAGRAAPLGTHNRPPLTAWETARI